MEWSSLQQLGFVLKSMVLGCCIGCVLDISGGFWRGKKHRRRMYAADVFCCVLSAVITFFGALVITDGQLHPMLFVGIIPGVFAEHLIVGRWLSLIVYKIHRLLHFLASAMTEKCQHMGRMFGTFASEMRSKRRIRPKKQKNLEKF